MGICWRADRYRNRTTGASTGNPSSAALESSVLSSDIESWLP